MQEMRILISLSKLKMVRSSKYFHSVIIIIAITMLFISCEKEAILYKRVYTDKEKLALSESLLNSAGTDAYYQGSVAERMIIHEGNKYNPDNAWGQREIGVPYLKRGFAAEANQYYELAAAYDAEEWLGYKAYCWLYFYRDYETALDEVNRFDALTPGEVDYPQSTSVNYMRGICYLQLGRYDEAIDALTLHLNHEIEAVGHKYIEPLPYLSLAMSYQKNGDFEGADSLYSLGIKYNNTTSDLYYYKAKNLLNLNQIEESKVNLDLAQDWYSKGAKNLRPYVEEFFAIYQEDLDELSGEIDEIIH